MIISKIKAAEAASILGIELDGLGEADINRAYRIQAKDCHPDHHGSEKLEQWSRVSWAKEVLSIWAKKHPPEHEQPEPVHKGDCRGCGGTGRVPVVRRRGSFGQPLTMACVICKGLGTVVIEENDCD
jgi:DnaJ-class molecular chaperone